MHETLDAFLKQIETLHPKSIDLGLERVSAVLTALLPEPLSCPIVSIAGTNGKGSTATALTALGVAAGLRIGTYTSPHLIDFNERICINHQPISDEVLLQCFKAVDAARGDITLTYFEYATLAALKYFYDQKLDAVILEVGMGGRLDAVNAVEPDLSIITHIGLDHTQWLGETLEAIADEKAGIMRPDRTVLIGDEVMGAYLQDKAWAMGAKSERLGVDFPLLSYQGQLHSRSLSLAAHAAGHLKWYINFVQMKKVLENVQLPGRFQVIPHENGELILDVAHNPDAIATLVQRLRETHHEDLHVVLGVLDDKAIEPMLDALRPFVKQYYCCTPDSPRALSATALAAKTGGGDVYPSPQAALDAALEAPGNVLVTGSFCTVGSIMGSHGLCYNLKHAGEGILC